MGLIAWKGGEALEQKILQWLSSPEVVPRKG